MQNIIVSSTFLLFESDPRLTDYDTLLQNVNDLKAGKQVQVPIYDFKSSSRTGYRLSSAYPSVNLDSLYIIGTINFDISNCMEKTLILACMLTGQLKFLVLEL